MKYRIYVLTLLLWMAHSAMSQSLTIDQSLHEIPNSSVLVQYKNLFGKWEMPDKDVPFPYSLILIRLEGSGTEVTAAQQTLGLFLGNTIVVADMDRTRVNELLFLVPTNAKNIYLTCGNGCPEQLLASGIRLRPNSVYTCKVHYEPEEIGYGVKKPKITSQYLLISVEPKDAMVFVDGEQWSAEDGVASGKVPLGKHVCRVECRGYHEMESDVVVTEDKTTLAISLKPAYGYLTLIGNSDIEGASVYVDNRLVGTVPMNRQHVPSGKHTLRVVKPMYKAFEQLVEISDEQNVNLTITLQANFVNVTLKTLNNAEIWIDNERKGSGSWTGPLIKDADYIVETRLVGHRDNSTKISVSANSSSVFDIPAPIPMYGGIDVNIRPQNAEIWLDGTNTGKQTPALLENVLKGKHVVKIRKSGYTDFVQSVEVDEGQMTSVTGKMDVATQIPQPTNNSAISSSFNSGSRSGYMTSTNSNQRNTVKKGKFDPTPTDSYMFGLELGYISKSIRYQGDKYPMFGFGDKGKVTSGFRLGCVINPTYKYGFGFRSGVNLEYAHAKMTESDLTGEMHDITINIPFQFTYRLEFYKDLSVMFFTGPVLSFGAVATFSIPSESFKFNNLYSLNDQNEKAKYEGTNVLLGVGGAFQWSHLRLSMGGEFGMIKKYVLPDRSEKMVKWDNPFFITLSYML